MDAKRLPLAVATLGLAFAALAAYGLNNLSATFFSDEERARIVQFWKGPNRFTVTTPKDFSAAPWQVRPSSDASRWLWNYRNKQGISKLPAKDLILGTAEQKLKWKEWIGQKTAWDSYSAQIEAALKNKVPCSVAPPPDPGPAPDDLIAWAGEPPAFLKAVQPRLYLVRFEDITISSQDNPPLRADNPYYRNENGVMSGGTPVRSLDPLQFSELCLKAGLDQSARKIISAVSSLEGGFDSINTYDTGFVSVGVIQFACLSGGSGSLGQVLLAEKNKAPEAFEMDFRRYGIEVDALGVLCALDPLTGEELHGIDAARRIIDDKRLSSIFQRAGRLSQSFQVAQLRVAYDLYSAENEWIDLSFDDNPVRIRAKDLFPSEAWLATLMDRKVNTGKIEPIPGMLRDFIKEKELHAVDELRALELDVLIRLQFRKDFTLEKTLTQPQNLANRKAQPPSRGGDRSSTTGGD